MILQEGLNDYESVNVEIRYDNATFREGRVENVIGTVSGSIAFPMRSMLGFGLEGIPPNSTINDVALEMTVNRIDIQGVGTGDIEIYLSNPAINAEMVEADVNWYIINFDGPGGSPNFWPVSGGDPTTLLSSVPEFGSEAVGTVKTFANTAEFVAAAQDALDSNAPLDLVIMAPDSEPYNQRNFVAFWSDDCEYEVDGEILGLEQRPKLTISYTYTLPGPGDANYDGSVDSDDAAILAANWQNSGGWLQGDFTGDGLVDDTDATILAANWGVGTAASVPEPGMAVVLISALVAILFWRKRSV